MNFLKDRRGQTVVWVVLVTVVGLTLGLSMASRSLSNLEQSTQLEESNRAFSAAEAGIEKALYSLETEGGTTSLLTPIPLSDTDSEYYYSVSEGGGGPSLKLSSPLSKDQVFQVDCSGMEGTITAYWVKKGTSQSVDGNRASLFFTFVSQESIDDYEVSRYAYNPAEEAASRSNGFDTASIPSGEGFEVDGDLYLEKTASMVIPGTAVSDKILRLHSFYNQEPNDIVLVSSSGDFPSQYHSITATGLAGETKRTVQVTRSKPSLPSIFDYALFNLSADSLSK